MYQYQKRKVKEYIKTISIILLILTVCVLLYNMYIDIDVTDYAGSEYTSSKLQQTSNQVQINEKGITNTIEEVSESVVGISKLQDSSRNRNNNLTRRIHLNKSARIRE